MEETFELFKYIFGKRYDVIPVAHLGEDSIRYDFFSALIVSKKLEPHQIQLEYPIDDKAYNARKTVGSKRGENPQIDLWVSTIGLKIAVEFGFFRRNKNENGSISVTENVMKMFNDFMRLALHCSINQSLAYFVCIADEKMLNNTN
jgi:hypothetical protein